jgi:flotillin
MAGYKDDLEAAHARISALERELSDLRGEGDKSTTPDGEETPYVRPRPIGSVIGLCLMLLPFLAAVGYIRRHPGVWVVLGMTAIMLLMVLIMVRALVELVRPCELLVLSGRRHRMPDGSVVGHRLVYGGRVIRMPLVERTDRMDLRVQRVDWAIAHAYSRGGVPVSMAGYLLIAVSSDPALAVNAVERFLGRDATEMARVAEETLEGHARAVIAQHTLEEMQEDRVRLVQTIVESASSDLEKLGLELLGLGVLELRSEVRG